MPKHPRKERTPEEEFRHLIRSFVSRACCKHTQNQAYHVWTKLRPLLTEQERDRLSIAWSHSFIEGFDELFSVEKAILRERKVAHG